MDPNAQDPQTPTPAPSSDPVPGGDGGTQMPPTTPPSEPTTPVEPAAPSSDPVPGDGDATGGGDGSVPPSVTPAG